jgi:hypothetical protein
MTLRRLIITFKDEELVLHALYKTEAGPNPGTKARRRELEELIGEGLHRALASLEGHVDVVGTSGYEVREDTVSAGRTA